MIRLKSKGLQKIVRNFEYIENFNAQKGLIALAQQIQKNAKSKMANITGEQRKNTVIGTVNPNFVIVAVNIVYAAYQEEGQRRDGTYKVKNRNSPAQDHAMKKAILESNFDGIVDWVNYELKTKLKK
jgi:hypothetical protein